MVKRGFFIKIKGFSLAWTLRLLRMTWRVHFRGRENLDRLYNTENRFLLCFWHGKYVPIFPLLEGYKACVISSLSGRGSIIAEICENFGYQSAQIPDRPRRGSLKDMEIILSGSQAGGIVADGPLGPQHRVKSGVIWMASVSGFELLPVSVGSHRKIVLNRRWDRMEIPLPFTTVFLVFGKPIEVPPNIRKAQIREWANHLAGAITTLSEEAQGLAGGKDKSY